MMSKYIIADLDAKATKGNEPNLEKAMAKVVRYITEKIDRYFPEKEFYEWMNSDTDKPFKCNGNSYHWN